MVKGRKEVYQLAAYGLVVVQSHGFTFIEDTVVVFFFHGKGHKKYIEFLKS